jgi:hypothetical protein
MLVRILGILFFVAIAIFAYVTPVFDIDSLAYHLPIVTQLIKTGSIFDVFHAGFVGPNTYFPANHEALQAFLTMLTGTSRFNFLPTLLGIFLFTASLSHMARKEKLNRAFIFLTVLAVASVPFLFSELLHFQVDLFLFCLFGSLVALLFSAFQNRDHRDMAKVFLLIGLVIGTKYNGIMQALVLLPVALGAMWFFRKWLKRIWWYPLLALLTGAIWYIRNWIITGNPIYPFGVNFGFFRFEGHDVFLQDMADSSILHAIFQNGMLSTFSAIFRNVYFENLMGGIGFLLLFFVAFLLLGMFIFFIKHRKKINLTPLFLFLALFYLFLGETLAYFQSPYTFRYFEATIRYSSAIFALIPVTFVLAAVYSKFARLAIGIFAIFFFSYNMLFHSFIIDRDHQALLFGKISKDEFLGKKWNDYPELLRHLQILRNRNDKKENTIALTGMTPYGLFGREGLNAMYVNIDGCLPCKYHDYRSEKKSVRAFPDKKKWKEALAARSVDYLMVGRTHYRDGGQKLFEEVWANEDRARFKKLLATEKYALYKVK